MLSLRLCRKLRIEHDNSVDFGYAGAGGHRNLLHGFKRDIPQGILDLMKHFDAGTCLIFVLGHDQVDLAKRFCIQFSHITLL